MREFKFKTFDNTDIACWEFVPENKPKAVIQIIHGLQEYGLRYRDFALFLNKQGYIVLVSDQRLHGKTAGANISVTNIKDVMPVMLKDQMLISDYLIEKFKLPLIVLGHSFGSFLTQWYLQEYDKVSGIILSGSCYMKSPEVLMGKIVAKFNRAFYGGETQAKFIEKLVQGGYGSKFKGNGSWLSLSKSNSDAYYADKLCGQPLCINFYYSMFKHVRKLYQSKNIKKVSKKLPIFIISGKDDPVGKFGKGVIKLYNFYKKNKLNASMKLYEKLRHEILNEDCKEKIYQDVLLFTDNVVKIQKKEDK